MAKIISVHSFRGGTGKSNTTANLATLLALAGKRVGVIDTDIHSPGIHVIFGLQEESVEFTLNDYLWGRCRIEQAAREVVSWPEERLPNGEPRGRVILIPSSVRAGEIARILRDGYDVGLLTDGFRALIRELDLDYLFIDTHPGVNEETLLSIALSDTLLLIMRPDNQDFQGTAVTVELARRLEVNDLQIIVNKVPPGMDVDLLRAQVEAAYKAQVVGLLPLDGDIARLGSAGIFAMRFPDHPLTRGLQQVADHFLT
ncbi:MinD/ParA family ATP-binding protein [Paludisphaera mucosa]|uniref:MinD/ParA family protein n=1 Tax=Paludisphaera mucosa TaxID=3030827 RepID=A0ABT6FI16_9BACT|nr:MinD/ParA family protein [Paludisphaera mucosa]MDG3007231.1 MinD/ParA family protein [Paludisphaera mucosa]